MINKDSDSTQRRHIIQSDRNGFYFNMEREGQPEAMKYFREKPYAAAGGSLPGKVRIGRDGSKQGQSDILR